MRPFKPKFGKRPEFLGADFIFPQFITTSILFQVTSNADRWVSDIDGVKSEKKIYFIKKSFRHDRRGK
jgi:hypothetical protein